MDKMRDVLTLLVLLCHSVIACAGDSHGRVEHQVKAAFLYKFAGYVEWPPTALIGESFNIGVVGADDIADELQRLNDGIRIHNLPVSIKRFSSTDQIVGVHVLFVGQRAGHQLPLILQQAGPIPVLTITEWEGALDAGSIINFVPVDGYIRFEISKYHADRSNIKISARLLNVALNIQKRG